MLVISRKPQEAVKIGPDIIVHVLSVRDGRVRVGIEAPNNLKILRTEIEDENETRTL